jgi:cyclase
MKRSIKALAFAGLIFTGISSSFAQTPTPTVTTQKLTDNIYTVTGMPARTGFVVGDKGVLVIDANMNAEGTKLMLAEIAKVTSLPVTKLILTHSDSDHVYGMVGLPKGIEIISQQQAKAEMETEFKAPDLKPLQAYLPTITFGDTMNIMFAPENIKLIHFAHAHTSGDAAVVFPAEKLAFTGDIVVAGKDNPVMHPEKGSNTAGLEKALEGLLKLNVDRFVTGHHGITTKSDINAMIKNIKDTRAKIRPMIKEGKSLEEVKKALGVVEQTGGYHFASLAEIIYKELTSKK